MNAPNPADSPTLQFAYRRKILTYATSNTADPLWRPLPLIPSMVIEFMVGTCARFWSLKKRCLAMALVFNPTTGSWLFEMPKQICGPNSSTFITNGIIEMPMMQDYLMAGTLQSFAYDTHDELHHVPPIPGLHFACAVPDFQSSLSAVLCSNQPDRPVREVRLSSILVSDHRLAIDQASSRLTILDE